tara:strand:+ start:5220 stop:5858 length:639 start_codon:yes stop_codon:yes gene_type:complete
MKTTSMNITELAQVLWNYHQVIIKSSSVDVIIGVGSYDIQTALHCAELYYKKVADTIVFTGGLGDPSVRQWGKPDAEAFTDKAIELGVPWDAIHLETKSTSLNKQIENALQFVKPISSAMLVAQPNALRNALATAEITAPDIKWFSSCIDRELTEPVAFNHTFEDLIHEMVGDIQKLIEYSKIEALTNQEIPKKVLSAYQELIKKGFTKHCV